MLCLTFVGSLSAVTQTRFCAVMSEAEEFTCAEEAVALLNCLLKDDYKPKECVPVFNLFRECVFLHVCIVLSFLWGYCFVFC